MNLKHFLAGVSFLTAGLAVSANSAQAFNFTTNLAPGSVAPKGDIFLQSVQVEGGNLISDFSLVKSVNILSNDLWTGGNTGAASADRGDTASGINAQTATNANLAANLGNLNLNNIVDTEDTGSFKMNLSFEKAVSSLFFWERGMNSKVGVQALDVAGNLIGNLLVLDSKFWKSAGFSIDTTEIDKAQVVGAKGLTLADLGVAGPIQGIQLTSLNGYNGPDFKVIGSTAEAVPEPTTMAGLALAGAGMAWARRRNAKKA